MRPLPSPEEEPEQPATIQPSLRPGELLPEETVRRMAPRDSLDAQLFVALNVPPHPRWLDRVGRLASEVTNGGWVWAAAATGAWLLRVPGSGTAAGELLATLTVANLAVEFPIKAFFRRQRPFIAVVRAVVVGRKPGTWSFPSGHTATSFAAAWTLSRRWPRATPAFLGLAALVGMSRIYVGVHYPSDVLSGAVAGISLSEACRRSIHLIAGRGAPR